MEIVKMVPCILHLEIRVGIKMLETILAQGLNSYTIKVEQHKFMSEVKDLMNSRHVLGGPKRKSHRKFPCELSKKTG
jgi:hypothetical protein